MRLLRGDGSSEVKETLQKMSMSSIIAKWVVNILAGAQATIAIVESERISMAMASIPWFITHSLAEHLRGRC